MDDNLAEAHNTLGQFLTADYKFAEGEAEFKIAIALNPNYSLAHHWYAICLMELGREKESLEEMRIAAELDPLSAGLASNMAYDCFINGKAEESQTWLKKVDELDTPRRFFDFIQALLAEQKEDFEGAALHAEEALRRYPSNSGFLSMLGFYYARLGRREKAEEILQKLARLPDAISGKQFDLALVYSGLGDKDEMFRQARPSV